MYCWKQFTCSLVLITSKGLVAAAAMDAAMIPVGKDHQSAESVDLGLLLGPRLLRWMKRGK